jgi:hypothetical protein
MLGGVGGCTVPNDSTASQSSARKYSMPMGHGVQIIFARRAPATATATESQWGLGLDIEMTLCDS